jgi:hypothetical protein
MMDGGAEFDITEVLQNIDEAQVVTLYFPFLTKTLLIDTRTDDLGWPLVRLVPIADSAQDRFSSLEELRPELPRPDSITMIPWMRRVESLADLGVWQHLIDRLDGSANGRGATVRAAADDCLCELRELQRREFAAAITGDEYQTLWSRTGLR